jgi:serine/threonine protein phosphatase 1
MSKTYAIADLHGRLDLLEMALAQIASHAELPATLVTLGDYVDRGPDGRKVIERLMGGLGQEGWQLICLKGNHEDIMWQTCRRKVPDCSWWLDNGGGATLISYGQNEGDQADVTVVLDEHLKWIERLPLMHVDKHRIFVLAWYTGRLAIAVFDDKTPGGPLEFLEVQGQPIPPTRLGFLGNENPG